MDEPIIQQKESVKLMKMSKGWNWELKLISDRIEPLTLERLKDLNKRLEEQYGDKEQKGDNGNP